MGEEDTWTNMFRLIRHIEEAKARLEEARAQRDKEIANIYHNKGVSVAQIARRLGLSRQTVHKILAEQGVKN